MTRQQALDMAAHYDKEVQGLIDRYGTGVRPSFVSADIAMAQASADRYRQLADDLKEA